MSGTYNAVAPKTSLKQQQKSSRDPANWPPELHTFIGKSFAKANELKLNPDEKKKFQAQMKELIEMAILKDKITVNDWKHQQLPALTPGQSDMKLDLHCEMTSKMNKANGTTSTSSKPLHSSSTTSMVKSKALKRKNVFGDDSSDNEDEISVHQIQPKSKPKPILFASTLPKLKKVKKEKKDKNIKSQELQKQVLLSYNNDTGTDTISSTERLKLRGKRFERELNTDIETAIRLAGQNDTSVANNDRPLVGTCQVLEKKYLRLTSQPNPETVRPLPVLRKTLQLLIDKYLTSATYNYLNDQFKSLRQDLTVQHIKTDFTVQVYEFNCKLAIEFQDLGEFNQCQSQLKSLYQIPSLMHSPNKSEYRAYTILYYIITNNLTEAFELKYNILKTAEGANVEEEEYLKDAFLILDCVMLNDYYKLFAYLKKLKASVQEEATTIKKTEHLNIKRNAKAMHLNHPHKFFFLRLLQPIMNKERIRALSMLCKTYRKISWDFLKYQLTLEDDSELFIEEYKLGQFLDSNSFDCASARLTVETVKQSKFKKVDIKGQI